MDQQAIEKVQSFCNVNNKINQQLNNLSASAADCSSLNIIENSVDKYIGQTKHCVLVYMIAKIITHS